MSCSHTAGKHKMRVRPHRQSQIIHPIRRQSDRHTAAIIEIRFVVCPRLSESLMLEWAKNGHHVRMVAERVGLQESKRHEAEFVDKTPEINA